MSIYIESSTQSQENFIYYVYAYLREDGSPYYIGKGRDYRAYRKHSIQVPKDKSRIIFLEKNLSEVGAFAFERRYIQWYGRKDNNTGILRNLTDGGEGSCGKKLSESHRMKLRNSNIGRKRSDETKEKIRKALTGKRNTKESIEKMRVTKFKTYLIKLPSGKIIETTNLKNYCYENKLSDSQMSKVANNKAKQHKGYQTRHKDPMKFYPFLNL